MTIVLKISATQINRKKIELAAQIIQKGGLVAFPTETVYGLGANAFNSKAVEKIFKAKNRPKGNPLIVHIGNKRDLPDLIAEEPLIAKKLIREFWPGPLTLVFKKSSKIPSSVTAGLDSVAIRMPSHPVALALIQASNVPIAAPSANQAGKPSATNAKHVWFDLNEKIDGVLDAGKSLIGLESTVLDITTRPPTLLRPGKVSLRELEKIIGKVALAGKKIKWAKSPGMKWKHYAPNAKVVLVHGAPKKIKQKIIGLIQKNKKKKVGVILLNQKISSKKALVFSAKNVSIFGKNLFNIFRKMDSKKIRIIFVQSVPENGLGLAIMNRLKKAARQTIRA